MGKKTIIGIDYGGLLTICGIIKTYDELQITCYKLQVPAMSLMFF